MNHAKADFCITIDFKKSSENPSRVFQTMTDLIRAFQALDSNLIRGIDSHLEPIILLEDVEIGSLRTWLTSVIRGVPDEAVKDGDFKKVIGHYLLKAKYIILNRLEGKVDITDAKVIHDIRRELQIEAQKTDIKQFPLYEPIPMPKLIKSIDEINKSLSFLDSEDKAFFKSSLNEEATFNLSLNFSPDHIENLLTKESLASDSIMILKVKKPDYLGTSQWEFKHNAKSVSAKVLHESWLLQFQQRKIDIRPGDAIKAKVRATVKYGHDNAVLGVSYDIIEVIEVLPLNSMDQLSIE